ncbi:MAG: serine hydrolase domain-containing protein [Sphingomonadaceae bacterium]
MRVLHALRIAASLLAAPASAQPATAPASPLPEIAAIRAGFAEWRTAQNVPGLVWGVVKDGALVHVEASGVADLETGRPVTPDTRFRLASMTKALTGYTLLWARDQAQPPYTPRRHLDMTVAEVTGRFTWAPTIRLADLMHHSAGFVTDDPWGDRQEDIDEATFDQLFGEAVPLSRAPGTAYEYSNTGYALMGLAVESWTGKPWIDVVEEQIFGPLGMTASGFDIAAKSARPLAIGYRFENGAHAVEPQLRPGLFTPIGGLITTARDYSKWVAHLLSAWPAEADPAPEGKALERARLREVERVGGHMHSRAGPGANPSNCPPLVAGYGAGLVVAKDCALGDLLFHSGGYPGYGSHMLLMPNAGVGIFAFANRTYAAPLAPVWDAADRLRRAGYIADRPIPVSPHLAAAHAAATRIWAAGSVEGPGEAPFLAMNMLLDRSATNWAAYLAELKAAVGTCDTSAPIAPTGQLSGTFEWRCERGSVRGQLLLAPTRTPQIQALRLSRP